MRHTSHPCMSAILTQFLSAGRRLRTLRMPVLVCSRGHSHLCRRAGAARKQCHTGGGPYRETGHDSSARFLPRMAPYLALNTREISELEMSNRAHVMFTMPLLHTIWVTNTWHHISRHATHTSLLPTIKQRRTAMCFEASLLTALQALY
jgi:hypothetical protein